MKRYFVIILLFFCIRSIVSQVTAPSETGFIDVLKAMSSSNNENLYSGNIATNIPLYTYKDNDFEIPLSLHYSSSGYKTYAPIGCVGLGWALNAGGFITRKVNGIPDEVDKTFSIIKNNLKWLVNLNGYNKFSTLLPKNYKIENGEVLFDYQNGISYYGTLTNLPDTNRFETRVETNPDMFAFNFLGQTGKFMLNDEGTFTVFDTSHPEGEYKIEILSFGHTYPNKTVRIQITTGDGYKYTFEDITASDNNEMSFWHTNPLYPTHSTSFPLVEIEAPNGRKVTIEYNAKESNTTVNGYFSRSNDWSSGGNPSESAITTGYLTSAVRVQPISKITIGNTIINFLYSVRVKEKIDIPYLPNEYGSLLDVVRKLESISIEDNRLTAPLQKFTFNYGYGKDVGYTASRPVLLLKGIDASGSGKYNMDYFNEDKPFPTFLKGRDFWGYWNNSTAEDVLPGMAFDLATNIETSVENANGYSYLPDFSSSQQGMLRKITYPTGGFTRYYYEPNDYGSKLVKDLRNNHNNNSYLESVNNEISGGLRLRRMTNYVNSMDSVFVDYGYRFLDNPSLSTGILLHNPRFYREVNYTSNGYTKKVKQVSWLNDFISSEDGLDVAYSQVTTKSSDGSYCVYNFSDYTMFPDLPHNKSVVFNKFTFSNSDLAEPNNFFARNDSRHRIRGKLLSKLYYNNANKLTYKEEYNYDFEKFNSDLSDQDKQTYPYPLPAEANSYSVQEAFSYFYIQKNYTRSCPLKSLIKSTYPSNSETTPTIEEENFSYNNVGQMINKEVKMSNGNKSFTKIKYPYDLRSTGGWPNNYDNMFDNGFRNFPIKTQKSILNKGITLLSNNDYTNIGLNGKVFYSLSEIKNTELSSPLLLSDFSPDIDTYLKTQKSFLYDSKGNIKQISYKDGTTITYLFSYNYQYPVAEIKNATYVEVEAALGNATQVNNLAAANIPDMTIVEALRTKLPKALVFTYTYKPLIGLISKTDPRGVTTNYTYDTFNRLYLARDNNKNIVGKYNYAYQNQTQENNSNGGYAPISASIQLNSSSYLYGATGTASLTVSGGTGSYTYNWYVKDNSGNVLASTLNTNATTHNFTCNQTTLITVQCVITDAQTGSTFSTYQNINPICFTFFTQSARTASNFFYNIAQSIINNSTSISGYLIFYSDNIMNLGTSYLIGNFSSGLRPTVTQTMLYDTSGRTLQLTFNPDGSMYVKITSGTTIPAYQTINIGQFSFNLYEEVP